jgi:spermidine synthase
VSRRALHPALRGSDPRQGPPPNAATTVCGVRRPPLELLVFVTGTASLGSEIAAARLMAPFFGASTIVWANTIAIVLVALSVGYWLGGRLADRHPDPRALYRLVLAAALLLALVPLVADPFLSLSVKAFDQVSVGAFAGSLFGVLVLVALPVLLLGAVSPWAIRLKVDDLARSGEVAGRLYAISTVGSLVGTFLAALLLIPAVGTQRTFLCFALAVAIVAAVGLRGRALLAPVAVAALLALPVGVIKATEGGGGARVVHEADTTYQYARVVEYPDGERHLELNEGQAIHSVYRPDTVLTGDYWDGFLVDTFAGRTTPPRRLAVLGDGAGTMVRAYGRYFPRTQIDAVEIDGELTEIGKRYFGLRERAGVRFHAADARPFLRASDVRYDAIFVDAYHQPYIPFYLATKEFFELVRDRLTPDGVVLINVGHPQGSDALEKVLTATMGAALKYVVRDPIEDTNTILIGGRGPVSAGHVLDAAAAVPGDLRTLARDAAFRIAPPLRGGSVYTDDRAPVEWLVDRSIVRYAAGER